MEDKKKNHMLSTIDNPFNPFTEWDDWYNYDSSHGYYTPALLDRVVFTSEELSDADQDLAIEWGIDEIIEEDVLGLYVKVVEP